MSTAYRQEYHTHCVQVVLMGPIKYAGFLAFAGSFSQVREVAAAAAFPVSASAYFRTVDSSLQVLPFLFFLETTCGISAVPSAFLGSDRCPVLVQAQP
ncbi:hypothetical protein QBC46DRAFT_396174 [Diplogelasinospora grovesii]|uniref:Uncharacterized protein n=1 Tax=Diplogelasinospora grovesii TaxID=303347 RepID=A0AAN6MZT6_9PEZI|nr:hypothetical protein QBC46DRAFT_396174 [Diplogelasinospora grovesii]